MNQTNKYRYLSIIIIILLIFLIIYKLKYFENINNFENENETGKIAFLFLTYNNLKREDIWNRFFNINDNDNNNNDIKKSIYYNKFTIYNHAKEPDKITNKLINDRHIPEHIETCWGCFGTVEANIFMMKQALQDPLNKKFILISDSCIPIVSFNTFYNKIMKDDKSKIDIFYNQEQRYNQIINPSFTYDKFTKSSAQGLIFNRKHTELLVNSLLQYKDNWKNMGCVDEHYFGNILRELDSNFELNNNKNKNTFDIWNKYDLNLNTICNDNIETICVHNNMNIQSAVLINKLSNKMIDELRDKNFLLLRKVDNKTEIDINYILNL